MSSVTLLQLFCPVPTPFFGLRVIAGVIAGVIARPIGGAVLAITRNGRPADCCPAGPSEAARLEMIGGEVSPPAPQELASATNPKAGFPSRVDVGKPPTCR